MRFAIRPEGVVVALTALALPSYVAAKLPSVTFAAALFTVSVCVAAIAAL